MYFLTKFCCLCLRSRSKLKNLNEINSINADILNKLIVCTPGIFDIPVEVPKFICGRCCTKLNAAFQFREMCFQNFNRFQGYVQKLKNSQFVPKTTIAFNEIVIVIADDPVDLQKEPAKSQKDLSDESQKNPVDLQRDLADLQNNPVDLQRYPIDSQRYPTDPQRYPTDPQRYPADLQTDFINSQSNLIDLERDTKDSHRNSSETVSLQKTLTKSLEDQSVPIEVDDEERLVISEEVIPEPDTADLRSDSIDNLSAQVTDPVIQLEHKSEEFRTELDELYEVFKQKFDAEGIELHQQEVEEANIKMESDDITIEETFDLLVKKEALDAEIESANHTSSRTSSLVNGVEEEMNKEATSSSVILPYACSKCEKSFEQTQELELHMVKHLNQGPHFCSVCNKEFERRMSLKKHEILHLYNTSVLCFVCGKHFKNSQKLNAHMQVHNKNGLSARQKQKGIKSLNRGGYTCSICKETFTYKAHVRNHMLLHFDEKPFHCQLCNRYFKKESYLHKHIAHHPKEISRLCPTCGKTFTKRHNLVKHEKLCSNEEPKIDV